MDQAPSRIENPVDGEESKLLLHRFDWIETRVAAPNTPSVLPFPKAALSRAARLVLQNHAPLP